MIGPPVVQKVPLFIGGLADMGNSYQMAFDLRF